jgi:hypothetical protein
MTRTPLRLQLGNPFTADRFGQFHRRLVEGIDA